MALSLDLHKIYLGYCTALLLLYCAAWFHLEYSDSIGNGNALLASFLRNDTHQERSRDSQTMNCYEEDAHSIDRIKLFAGEAVRHSCSVVNNVKTIELVVAYCHADLRWMYDRVLNTLPNQEDATLKMTILSKCGQEGEIPNFIEDHRVSEVNIIPVENVGGCDYAYAYFVKYYLSKEITVDVASTVIIFMKDTDRIMKNFHFYGHSRYRTIPEMLNIAINGEFACGIKTECVVSPFQAVEQLERFMMKDYTRFSDRSGKSPDEPLSNPNGYRSLGDFHRRGIGWEFPSKNLIMACFGGTFALPLSRLVELSQEPEMKVLLLSIHGSLNRTAMPMVEEHYMERTWAGLFSRPLSEKHTEILRSMQMGTLTLHKKPGIKGPLIAFAQDSCSKQDARLIDGRVHWDPNKRLVQIEKRKGILKSKGRNGILKSKIIINTERAVQEILQQELNHTGTENRSQ